MAWGIFRKIKEGLKKAGQFIARKVAPVVRKVIDTGVKLAPVIGGAISTAITGNPMLGAKAGTIVKGIGNKLGLG